MKALENRIPPPLVFFLVAALMWAATWVLPVTAIPDGWRWSIAGLLFVLAVLLASSGIGAFRRAKTPLDPVHIDRASTLVTSGIYGFTRNPMYLGLTTLLLAWAEFLSAPWTLLGPAVFALFIDRFQIAPEERAMRAKFGAEYDAYTRRVRRWM
jgi:protein-S-isoprenylcysteine O-methyltransferase Ste14